ncbi:MAG: hypothetical protein M5R42_21330 [Rhodocyclaceae bacterium]|nr:hypothetical protein [Rhodocyclaceae bacterium]
MLALLEAADRLANSSNELLKRTWRRYRPILYLAADSGMRPQEYLALSKSSLRKDGVLLTRIDGSGHEISVTKTPSGRRFIEISPDVMDMVRHYAEKHASDNSYDLVFPASNGKWLCRRNWQRRGFNVACLEAKLVETVQENGEAVERPEVPPIRFAAFFASMHIEKGTNLKKASNAHGGTQTSKQH